jgi:hypothetical protein
MGLDGSGIKGFFSLFEHDQNNIISEMPAEKVAHYSPI